MSALGVYVEFKDSVLFYAALGMFTGVLIILTTVVLADYDKNRFSFSRIGSTFCSVTNKGSLVRYNITGHNVYNVYTRVLYVCEKGDIEILHKTKELEGV